MGLDEERVRVVLCEPTRTQIVRGLGTGRITVTDLAAAVGRSRPVASQHLRLLRQEGFAHREP
jgi:DNA-binding transcriptional ArsR family regulator